jgi:hypothetical protein
MKNKKYSILLIISLVLFMAGAIAVSGQTTEFTYQGRLLDNGIAATAHYDMQCSLFDSPSAGSQQGATITVTGVAVSNGIFTVHLDFGAQFNGTERYLAIGIKSAGSPNPYTDLNPRQPLTSAPYSVRSLTAASADLAADSSGLGGIPSSGFIHNGTAQQAGSDFNVSGNGTAGGTLSGGTVNSSSAFSIGGTPVLSTPGNTNTFVGIGTGINNTTGGNSTFVGHLAGKSNTIGSRNSFFGESAGTFNIAGMSNSFFGALAGGFNVTGSDNSFFGDGAGFNNTASFNSFFGANSGSQNTIGNYNSFFGLSSGFSNTTGSSNSFFGSQSGQTNTAGSYNSFFGFNSGAFNSTGKNNSFFGQGAGFKNTTGQDNTFVGNGAGQNNDTAGSNTFIGSFAGTANTTGINNAFVGYYAGASNTNLCCNSFFGAGAGQSTNAGGDNAFFGMTAGGFNTSGSCDTFVGSNAGGLNTTGPVNSFFGYQAGYFNTTGGANTFVGANAGTNNSTGANNTAIGDAANVGTFNLINATAIGARAEVDQSNSMVLGSIIGKNGAVSDTNVGIGTSAPQAKLDIAGTSGLTRARISDSANAGLTLALFQQPKWTVATTTAGLDYFQIYNETLGQTALWIAPDNNHVGIGTSSPTNPLDVNGTVRVQALGVGGSTGLCWNTTNQISLCSSSLRYKKDVQPFKSGLELLSQLKPISFRWKADNMLDLGFGAEDVAKAEPLLVIRNSNGEVEGVKYDRISAVLVNAVNEQQTQIQAQQKQLAEQSALLEKQQRQIDDLKRLLISRRQIRKSVQKRGGRG